MNTATHATLRQPSRSEQFDKGNAVGRLRGVMKLRGLVHCGIATVSPSATVPIFGVAQALSRGNMDMLQAAIRKIGLSAQGEGPRLSMCEPPLVRISGGLASSWKLPYRAIVTGCGACEKNPGSASQLEFAVAPEHPSEVEQQ